MAKKKRRRWLKTTIIILVILIVGGLITANLLKKKDTATEVTTVTATRGRLVQTVPGTGRVQPEVQVKISANVSGEITGIYVEEGDRVRKGDLLVTLDRKRYEAAVEQAESALKSAEAALQKSQSELRRLEELFGRGMASEADKESAQADFQYRSAEVERNRAYLKQAKDDLSKTSIYAPMDGVVSLLNKEPGEMALGAQFQQDVIMIVADLSKMEVEVEVDESDIVDVALKDTASVEIDAYPDTTFRGMVREIAHTATTRGLGTAEEITNFLVKITLLDVPPGLRPGMSATADVVTDVRENTLHVPIQCVVMKSPVKKPEIPESGVSEGAKGDTAASTEKTDRTTDELIQAVFKVEESQAHQIPVTTGISSDTEIEVIAGLAEGDEVVSGPFRTLTQKLKDGDGIRATKESERKGKRNRSERSGSQGESDLMDEM